MRCGAPVSMLPGVESTTAPGGGRCAAGCRFPDPVRWYRQYSMNCSVTDDDLRRWCDAERALLDAVLDAELALLDDVVSAERAMLDAALDAAAAELSTCGGMMKPGSTTRAARRMTVKRSRR